jgi:RNA polymerase sigma-70 factor (ECF subfamily)
MTAPSPAHTEPSDAELMLRLRRGDAASLDMLIDRHQDLVYRSAMRILGEHELAEEVAADTFIALYEHAATFRGEARLSTWLYRVAGNKARNAATSRIVRQARRTRSLDAPSASFGGGGGGGGASTDDGPSLADTLADHSPAADARRVADDRCRIELLRRVVGELSEQHREVIELRFFEDLSYEEIADRLEIGLGTVKSRLSRARADLSERLRLENLDLFAGLLPGLAGSAGSASADVASGGPGRGESGDSGTSAGREVAR